MSELGVDFPGEFWYQIHTCIGFYKEKCLTNASASATTKVKDVASTMCASATNIIIPPPPPPPPEPSRHECENGNHYWRGFHPVGTNILRSTLLVTGNPVLILTSWDGSHPTKKTHKSWWWNRLNILNIIWVFPPKIGVCPPNHPFVHRVFHYEPSILGYPYFWKHPYDPTVKSWKISFPIRNSFFELVRFLALR